MLPSADVALSGLQDALSIKRAIQNLFAQGHRSIGIGRNGAIEVAQTQHRHRIQLPDGAVLVGGRVRNGLWHAGNGCRVVGGLWERDDPASTDAAIWRVGDKGVPVSDVVFEGVETRIHDGAGVSDKPYDIRNGERVRVRDCVHESFVTTRLPSSQGGTTGQAFCVGGGGWDIEVTGCRAKVLVEDDFTNWSSFYRKSGRVRVTGNLIEGFETMAATVDCDGLIASHNQGTGCMRVFMGKPSWHSPDQPATVRGVWLEGNQLFDLEGRLWRQVARFLVGTDGLVEDVLINGCQVHAYPASPGTNMVEVITREGGMIRDFRAANINVTTKAPLARLLSTRGPGVMRDLELYDWRVASGGVGQLYDIQGGFVPGTLYHHNVRVVREPPE